MTKREMFALIATLNADNAEVVDFCNHEIELIDNRKKEKTPTKAQKENETLMDTIEGILGTLEAPVTVTDLIISNEALADYSNQKISALLRKMVEAGRVIKAFEGKKAVFSIA